MGLRIFSLSADQELALLRKRVLELAGHETVSPRTEREALEALSVKNPFDVAIVCYRMWTGSCRRLMRVFRKNNPAGKFIVMVRLYGEVPEVEGCARFPNKETITLRALGRRRTVMQITEVLNSFCQNTCSL